MKKIRIITYHRAVNFGAILQAKGLHDHLKKTFPKDEVKMLDYRNRNLEARNFLKIFKLQKKKPLFYYRRLKKFRRYLPKNFSLDDSVSYSKKFCKVVEQINEQDYDLVIAGSDSIWKLSDNPLLPTFPNIYWLSNKISAKKASYAASAYQCNPELFKKYSNSIKKILNSYDLITVRDEFTRKLISSLGIDKEVHKIPDPAFYYKIKKTNSAKVLKKLNIDPNKPIFALITGINDPKIRKIVSYFRSKNYQIIGLSIYSDLVDYNLGDELTPDQWAEIFKYVNFCLTDRFHGAIFCIKSKTPFIAIETEGVSREGSKKYQLIKDFDIKKSYLDTFANKYKFSQFRQQFDWIMKNKKKYEQKVDQGLNNITKQNQIITEKFKKLV
jgi:polysaccharide pyruvyl transferase WcaK-like protein